MSDLIELLLQKPQEFDFFEAVAFLEKHYDNGSGSLLDDGKVKFSSAPGLKFPSSDINTIKKNRTVIQFFLSFMGLLGVSSPLPQYFSEHGVRYSEEKSAFTDFINIFDHRLYSLFYLVWKKYRIIKRQPDEVGLDIPTLGAYLCGELPGNGTGTNTDLSRGRDKFLSFVPRSAEGLRLLLTDYFPGVKVEVEQWVPRWARIQNLRELGVNVILGSEAMLGESVPDRNGKVRVVLKIEDRDKFNSFLPGSSKIADVQSVVTRFLPHHMLYDIEVVFSTVSLLPVVLGKGNAALGISASCGEIRDSKGCVSLTIQGTNQQGSDQ